MEIVYGCLMAAMVVCAILAIRASRLVASALWLAGLSALLAVLFYLLGAFRIAVIELSVGAGLVTVLLVFAIGVAGEETIRVKPLVPRVLAWGAGLVVVFLLGWLVLPLVAAPAPGSEPSLATLLWQDRALDVLIQVVLIFCGVVGILGILTEAAVAKVAAHSAAHAAAPGVTHGQGTQGPPVDSTSEPSTKQAEVRL
jgi:uncharacterized MnhB-related membrane protein